MLGSSRLHRAAMGTALLVVFVTGVWLLLSDTARPEPALTLRGSAQAAELEARAALSQGATEVAARASVPKPVRADAPASELGTIAGKLVDPNGEAIGSQPVVIIAEELISNASGSPEQWEFSYHVGDSNLARWDGDGLLVEWRETEPDGAFVFSDLQPGRYAVLAHHEFGTQRIETERRLYVTGDVEVELVLAVYRLVVEVANSGRSVGIHCNEWNDDDLGSLGVRDLSSRRRVVADTVSFGVKPNQTYLVGIDDGPRQRSLFNFREPPPGPWHVASGEEEAHIFEGHYLTRVTLDLTSDTGQLYVDLEDTAEPYSYGIEIDSLPSGKRVQWGHIQRVHLPLLIVLAPGRYRVTVDGSGIGGPIIIGADSKVVEPVRKRPESKYHIEREWHEIEIFAGQTSSLDYHFNEGGLLRVSTPSPDTRVRLAQMGISSCGTLDDGLGPAHADFELENAEGECTRLLSFKRPSSRAPNWRKLNGPLPAGEYVLRWKDPEDEVHERAFEIRVGEMTSVSFESER